MQRDAAAAAERFKVAAKAGNNEARFHLGIMYLTGNGVHKNMEFAQKNLQDAANVRPLFGSLHCFGHHTLHSLSPLRAHRPPFTAIADILVH